MMRKRLYIERLVIAALLLLLLALAPAMAQTVVHKGETTPLTVEQNGYDSYTWELYNDSTVNFATAVGTAVTDGDAQFVGKIDSATVNVLWKEPGTYFFKVRALNASGCTMNLKIGIVKVLNSIPTAIVVADQAVCEGAKIELGVSFTGTAPWSFSYTDGTTIWSVTDVMTDTYVITIDPGPTVTTSYWITTVTDKYGINDVPGDKVEQQINPLPAPTMIYHR